MRHKECVKRTEGMIEKKKETEKRVKKRSGGKGDGKKD